MTPCREWQGPRTRHGYGWKERHVYIHRWVMAQIHGWDALEGKVVMHLCDNPPCFRYDHLRIGTMADNNADMWNKGRGKSTPRPGEAHGMHKLTEDQVREIRSRWEAGEDPKSIAEDYPCNRNNIHMIVHRKTWKHVS